MKEFIKKFNELQRMLLLAIFVAAVLCLLALIPLFVFNQPGWLIGVGIGSVIELINIFLLYKGSDISIHAMKAIRFLGFYFIRMFLFLAGFAVTALFSYGIKNVVEPISIFYNSLWGVLIAYVPMQIAVVFVMGRNKKTLISASEDTKDEEIK